MPGVPQMSEEEMMKSMVEQTAPRKVTKGKVRRKKGSAAMAELAALRRR